MEVVRPKLGQPAERGYSMLELLVVLAIIIVVAALALANLRSSKKAAYESVTLSYLRTVAEAQEVVRIRTQRYASDLETLASNGFVEAPSASKLGYEVTMSMADGAVPWVMNANPAQPGTTGDRYFYIDATGVIRFSISGPADASSPPVGTPE